MNPLSIALLIAKLVPVLREPVVAIVKALVAGDDQSARQAFEAALRAQFVLRQKGVIRGK
jgi:hypothetical protein